MTLFGNFANTIQLFIVHPNERKQKYILYELLNKNNAIYIRFTGHNLGFDELQNQTSSAGQQYTIDDLDYVILDECDRANSAEFDRFLVYFLKHIHPIQLVIFSRELPNIVLTDPFIRSTTKIVPVAPQHMLPDYLAVENLPILEVFSFGSGRICVNGKKIENWLDRLPQQLFFYLIDKQQVQRNQLFGILWSGLTQKNATEAFNEARRNITAQLGFDIVEYQAGYYRLSPNFTLYYDINQYLALVEKADFSTGKIAIGLYSEANQLYSGDFLQGRDYVWIEKRRGDLQKIEAELLVEIAREKLQQGSADAALQYYGFAAKLRPEREDIAEALMRLYIDSGMPCEALSIHKRIYVELIRRINYPPKQEIQALAKEARQLCP